MSVNGAISELAFSSEDDDELTVCVEELLTVIGGELLTLIGGEEVDKSTSSPTFVLNIFIMAVAISDDVTNEFIVKLTNNSEP